MKKAAALIFFASLIVSGAAAQTATIQSADSNLTDTNIEVLFKGLPTNEDMTVESVGDDITQVATFNSTSTGSTTATWRHNPFEGFIALGNDGWTYRVRNSDGSFSEQFEIAHGNMLLALDTFTDNTVGNNWNTITSGSGTVSESNNQLEMSISDGGEASARLSNNITHEEVFVFDIDQANDVSFSGTTLQIYHDGTQESVFAIETLSGIHKVVVDPSVDEIRLLDSSDNVVEINAYNYTNFRPQFTVSSGASASNTMLIGGISSQPKISEAAWTGINQFNPPQEQLKFASYIQNDELENVGMEFSTNGSTWSTSLPSSGNSLYYRNTDIGELNSIATDTSEVLQGLTFNPIEPKNNTARVVPSNDSVTEDFVYEFLYEPGTEERRDLLVAWTLFNRSSGNEISQSAYPSEVKEENTTTYYNQFEETENLPPGEYRWLVEFRDTTVDEVKFFNMYRSIVEQSSAPIDFELRDPADGSTVNLTNGSYKFAYSVDSTSNGTLRLYIPQKDQAVAYSQSIDTGNTTQSVSVSLTEDQAYDWYLEFEEEGTGTLYESKTNSFNTAASTDDGGDGGGDGDEPNKIGDFINGLKIDLPGLYYFVAEEYVNVSGDAADYLAGTIIALLFAVLLGYPLESPILGAIGLMSGWIVSALLGLMPGWLIFALSLTTGYIVFKLMTGGE